MKIAYQKPYLPSPGAGSLRMMIPETYLSRSQMHVNEQDEEVLVS
jgi:hypothetical protein